MAHEHDCCQEGPGNKARPFWVRPLALVFYATAAFLAASHFFRPLAAFHREFYAYLRMMGLPVILGFVLGGMMDYYIPKEYVSKFLSGRHPRTIFAAAGLGFLMSACNHGILAFSMALHRKGASGPAVVSFLLASPWANLPMTFVLAAFFGWKGVLIILCALLVSVTTGLAFLVLERRGMIESNRHFVEVEAGFSVRRDVMLADMVLLWILIGTVLAALSAAFVPHEVFHRFVGPSFMGLLGTLAAAAVLEVCSEGTSPLAFEIYRQTGAFGNAFAFLMAGVVTDYTEVGLLWKNLGPRTALWMLAVTLPQVVLIAWVFNLVF
jgi:uncharacterized protein